MKYKTKKKKACRYQNPRVPSSCLLNIQRFKREYEKLHSKPEPERAEPEKVQPKQEVKVEPPIVETLTPIENSPKIEKKPVVKEDKKEEAKEKVVERKFNKKEWLIAGALILILSLFSLLGDFGHYSLDNIVTIGGYEFAVDYLYWSLLVGIGLIPGFILIAFAINPPGYKPVFHKTLHVIAFFFFSICGIVAFMVLFTLLGQYLSLNVMLSYYISAVCALLYEYLIMKLYCYDKLEAKFIGWELFRFALVGVVAALADFLCTSATRAALNTTSLLAVANGDLYITLIAVTVGFTVGVIINYVLSVYMVYKASTKSTAHKWWGVILFVALSAVGLFIGIGIEYWLYDLWQWTYILVFIIRTLVVLVWNYLSRKFILFR